MVSTNTTSAVISLLKLLTSCCRVILSCCYCSRDAMTIYAKDGNAGVKKVIQSLSKIDPENLGVIAL
jgi:hypothetical protein